MYIPNNKARSYVQNTWAFNGSNTSGKWIGQGSNVAYVVYSYGRHWPMFINYQGTWYENKDKYSVSTSRQHSQLNPLVETVKKTREEMLALRDKIEQGGN